MEDRIPDRDLFCLLVESVICIIVGFKADRRFKFPVFFRHAVRIDPAGQRLRIRYGRLRRRVSVRTRAGYHACRKEHGAGFPVLFVFVQHKNPSMFFPAFSMSQKSPAYGGTFLMLRLLRITLFGHCLHPVGIRFHSACYFAVHMRSKDPQGSFHLQSGLTG